MKQYSAAINRDSADYTLKYYRARWQPLPALVGLVACCLLIVFSGWAAVYQLVRGEESTGVGKSDAVMDLLASYLGVSTLIYHIKSFDVL